MDTAVPYAALVEVDAGAAGWVVDWDMDWRRGGEDQGWETAPTASGRAMDTVAVPYIALVEDEADAVESTVVRRRRRLDAVDWGADEKHAETAVSIYVDVAELAAFSTVGDGGALSPSAGDFTVGDLPDPRALPESPTYESTWLVPGHLIIGSEPGDPQVSALLDAGVTTFVSLIGEYNTEHYRNMVYPARTTANFLHFPVLDRGTCATEALVALVLELKFRLTQRREVIYVHCLGGHGRTGMVVIPLMAALFDLDDSAAAQFVVTATNVGRASDRELPWDAKMPETRAQERVTREANVLVRAHVEPVMTPLLYGGAPMLSPAARLSPAASPCRQDIPCPLSLSPAVEQLKPPASEKPPIDYVCPITHELMANPVICADGHSYEGSAIERWLASHCSSPKTNLTLVHKQTTPNHTLRGAIDQWTQAHPSWAAEE